MAAKLQIYDGINGCTLICANKNVDLVQAAKVFTYLPKNKKNTIIANAKIIEAAPALAKNKIRLISVEKINRKNNAENIDFYDDVEKLIDKIDTKKSYIDSKFFVDENILIVGGSEMKPLCERLEAQSRTTVLNVNLDAMAYNINYFRKQLKPTTKMLCLVKANAYGVGSYEASCLMQKIGVNYLAVAATDEGVALRRAGIKLPILVLTPEIDNLELMIRNKIEPEIHNFRSLQAVAKACNHCGVANYPVHIKINSGMNRQGFVADQIDELLAALVKTPQVKVVSTYTHLATADKFALAQLERFTKISDTLMKGLPYKIMRHALNSIGIEKFPQYQFDMVRLGVGLYGIGDFCADKTKVVSQLTSRIVQISEVPAGEAVGYGRLGVIGNKPKRIGVVPVGYADGLDRKFGNGNIKFTINGKRVPTIGNICMDVCMVDLTGVAAKEGDTVEIFGNSPTAQDLADTLGTISYEILTSIPLRVKRVYDFTVK